MLSAFKYKATKCKNQRQKEKASPRYSHYDTAGYLKGTTFVKQMATKWRYSHGKIRWNDLKLKA
jgi:hypothetical protein